uniref:Uncharacterized protein n=1 Tax=Fusarium oxysporum (strain Fo5176) TaxID=660025 RepID=A0A0D2XGP9_FUSOF
MHPRLSVNDPFSAISPTPPVQPCLSVSLPEHYSSNVEPYKHDLLGIFNVGNYDGLSASQNDQFQSFDYTTAQGFNANPHQPASGFPGPPTPPGYTSQAQAHQQQGGSLRNGSPDEQSVARGGSEEDENLTPAQSRRKAQNRAAYVSLFCLGLFILREDLTAHNIAAACLP